jgi:hypothetical protein
MLTIEITLSNYNAKVLCDVIKQIQQTRVKPSATSQNPIILEPAEFAALISIKCLVLSILEAKGMLKDDKPT